MMSNKRFMVLYRLGVTLLAVLAVFVMSSMVLLMINADLSKTYYTMIIKPFTNSIHITEVIVRAIPLCIIALGVCVAYRSVRWQWV